MKLKRSLFGLHFSPQFFHEEEGGGASPALPQVNLDNDAPVDGEKPVNFDELDKIPDPELMSGTRNKAPDLEEAPTPEEKPEEKKEETPAAKEEPPTPEAKKEDKPATVPEDDKDLDALKLKPGTHPKTGAQFEQAKAAAKEARIRARELLQKTQQLENDLKAAKEVAGKLPEDAAKELEDLRRFSAIQRLQNDPRIKGELEARITKVDDAVLAELEKLGMSKENREIMKKRGLDSYTPQWWKKEVLDHPACKDNWTAQARIQQAIINRENAKQANEAQVRELSENAGKFQEQTYQMEVQKWQKFDQELGSTIETFAKDNPWVKSQEIPANATAEEKAKIAAHNADFEKSKEKFVDYVKRVVTHDPKATAEVIFGCIRAERLAGELKTTKAEIETKNARIAELEKDIAATTSAGRVASRGQAPVKTPATAKAASQQALMDKLQSGKMASAEEAFEAAGFVD